MDRNDYNKWFCSVTGVENVHHWQNELASDLEPKNRLINIPTGFGKTAGTVLAWLYHRVQLEDKRWPRRLVYCLPMRVLVEQTESEIRAWLNKKNFLWNPKENQDHSEKVGVHVLMGGTDTGDWHLYPEECAVLIGTQDMLLSRALNRGYAAPRARWPMEFGLLNQDALWVLDEVQLMDVGLVTSAQLQQFREEDRNKACRPCLSWWMSATLQPEWLETVDTRKMVDELKQDPLTIPPEQRKGDLWDGISKPVVVKSCEDTTTIAHLAIEQHAALREGKYGRITLVVLNRVAHACEVYQSLLKGGRTPENTRLVHSRFRGAERKQWRSQFLAREHCKPGANLIIVATQVVEAGVDISAGCLITDLAPWPSLVQRFGRAARYGGAANIIVVDQKPEDDKAAAPYEKPELDAAREALGRLTEVSQKSLEMFAAGLTDAERSKLYPYDPRHLLLRKELDELFDTTPDLTGADLDISRFIRSGQERDCQVFWADWAGDVPPDTLQPARDALCSVPVYGDSGIHAWLFNGEKLKGEMNARVFIWDYLDDAWRKPKKKDIYPGRLVLMKPEVGGYSAETGFTGQKPTKKESPVSFVAATKPKSDERTASGQDNEALSVAERYQTIATHGAAVAGEVREIAAAAGVTGDLVSILHAAARYHDLGKAHPAFRGRIVAPDMQIILDLAKAPDGMWTGPRVHGFRHELAGALALMEILARTDQRHSALLGEYLEWIETGALVLESAAPSGAPATAIGNELRGLTDRQFNLLVYLVCAHHGKVRAALHACPDDQDVVADDEAGMPILGIKDADRIPSVRITDSHGEVQTIHNIELHLAPAHLGLSGRYGPSWRERTLALQEQYGPFTLAWLEALLRAADIRISRATREDSLLVEERV